MPLPQDASLHLAILLIFLNIGIWKLKTSATMREIGVAVPLLNTGGGVESWIAVLQPQKKGEVVGPAGGTPVGPRYLAEVC